MSTDRQEDSPERQRRQINDYAAKNGYRVVRWYEDRVDVEWLVSRRRDETGISPILTAVAIDNLLNHASNQYFAAEDIVTNKMGFIPFSTARGWT